MRPGVGLAQANAQAEGVAADLRKRFSIAETAGFHIGVEGMHDDMVAEVRPSILALMGAVVFVLLPVMVLSGLTMSPAVTAAAPVLFDLFGGRQSARTIHFLVANLLVLFVLVHIVEVFLSGVVNGMRSMITGRYVIRKVGR